MDGGALLRISNSNLNFNKRNVSLCYRQDVVPRSVPAQARRQPLTVAESSGMRRKGQALRPCRSGGQR